jgi:deoxyxylulose-5-phosphate synthase
VHDFVAQGQNDELRIEVEMWVEDEEGNKDYCKTIVIVQDNDSICLNTGSLLRSLEILRQKEMKKQDPVDNAVSNAMARMMASESEEAHTAFGDLSVECTNYMVKPTETMII